VAVAVQFYRKSPFFNASLLRKRLLFLSYLSLNPLLFYFILKLAEAAADDWRDVVVSCLFFFFFFFFLL